MKFKTIDDLPDEISEIFEKKLRLLVDHFDDLYHNILREVKNENIAFNILLNSFASYISLKCRNKNSMLLAKMLLDNVLEESMKIKEDEI